MEVERNDKKIDEILKTMVTAQTFEDHQKFDDERFGHITHLLEDLNRTVTDYIKSDNEWKRTMKPVFEAIPELASVGEGMRAFKYLGGGVKSFSAIVTAIGIIIVGIIAAIRFLLK